MFWDTSVNAGDTNVAIAKETHTGDSSHSIASY